MPVQEEAETFRWGEWVWSMAKVLGGFGLGAAGAGVAIEPPFDALLGDEVGSCPVVRIVGGVGAMALGIFIVIKNTSGTSDEALPTADSGEP